MFPELSDIQRHSTYISLLQIVLTGAGLGRSGDTDLPIQGLVVEGPVRQMLLHPGSGERRGAAVQIRVEGPPSRWDGSETDPSLRQAGPAVSRVGDVQKGPRVLHERRHDSHGDGPHIRGPEQLVNVHEVLQDDRAGGRLPHRSDS